MKRSVAVALDGVPLVTLPPEGQFLTKAIKAGEHRVVVTWAGSKKVITDQRIIITRGNTSLVVDGRKPRTGSGGVEVSEVDFGCVKELTDRFEGPLTAKALNELAGYCRDVSIGWIKGEKTCKVKLAERSDSCISELGKKAPTGTPYEKTARAKVCRKAWVECPKKLLGGSRVVEFDGKCLEDKVQRIRGIRRYVSQKKYQEIEQKTLQSTSKLLQWAHGCKSERGAKAYNCLLTHFVTDHQCFRTLMRGGAVSEVDYLRITSTCMKRVYYCPAKQTK